MEEKTSFSAKVAVIFVVLSTIFLALGAEIVLRVVFYQLRGKETLALVETFKQINHKLSVYRASQAKFQHDVDYLTKLYSPEGSEVLSAFEKKYTENFAQLQKEVNEEGSKFLMVYIPSAEDSKLVNNTNNTFFHSLATSYGVEYLDLTDTFAEFATNTYTLLPENGHLSRFGNELVVEALSPYIEKIQNYRSPVVRTERPELLGDLNPKEDSLWVIDEEMPYRVRVNPQGLRMTEPVPVEKTNQRILFLGDSITFGPYMPNHDTIAGLLGKKYADKQVMNAGIAGYNIEDERALFEQRARYTNPDMTILVVFDNDLYDFFYWKRNENARDRTARFPTPEETKFLAATP